MYEYSAKLIRIIDADTVTLDVDCGFHQWRRGQSYRLCRIDAPELPTVEGKAAKEALERYLAEKIIVVRTVKSDSFGRFLVEMTADGVNVSDWLVANGHAKYRTYSSTVEGT